MKLSIKRSKNIKTDFIKDVMCLDSLAYNEDMQGTYDSISNRFKKNKESYILAYDNKKLIGYICFFPISDELYSEMLISDTMKDDDISPDDIVSYKEGKKHNIFIISIIIDPSYRDKEAIKLITNEFIKFIKEKNENDYIIDKVLGTTVSYDGFKFATKLNFKIYKTYEKNYKLVMTDNVKLVINNDYEKTYKSDFYIMIPFTSNHNINNLKSMNNDELSKEFLKCMNDTAIYECDNSVSKDMNRFFLGKNYIACLSDEYDGTVITKEEIYMFLTRHSSTGIYVLTIMNLGNNFSPTQIEDQVTTDNIFIYDDNTLININNYMKNKFNLKRCGEAKSLLSISNKPRDYLEFECMMASESYTSNKINYKLNSKEFKKMCENNFAQYDFYEIYASRDAVVYVLHTFDDNLITNIQDEVPILFIMELIMFQDASVLRTNNKIVEQLSKSGSVSISFIESLYKEFGKTIRFWNKGVFKYETVQNLSSKINEAFGTKNTLDEYYKNQDFLEHIVNLRDVQNSNKESKILNIIAIVLTIVQVVPLIMEFIDWFFETDFNRINIFSPKYVFSVSTLLIIILIILIRKKVIKNKQRKMK